ncbi:hypothetical protein [Ulvibacter litoralis]|uniref:Lipoprotein n=1 Tax=Ulvibacter litoralis TaxID=227084 RepID=A0A1G7DU44_9FLAO|nr:hypothetical protein [Ulvibacter litoralis]GHC42316.1 hypothetical protein GCM10008083_00450 [Ulvibacter litoralis]SDE54932.1 hypothetical protein SAMN05421855_1011168 [Ulvibacter litoralis]
MIRFLSLSISVLLYSCGTPSKSSGPIIGGGNETVHTEVSNTSGTQTVHQEIPLETISTLPKGAVLGDFRGDATPFYAQVSHVDRANETTFVSFENNTCPQLKIPKTHGGIVSKVMLEGFDRELILLTAKLKDPNFNKYFLYVFRNNEWKPVMNGFAVHKSNLPEIEQVIAINPKNPNEILRNYSVFDIDETSELGYTWRLLQESVPIENR